MGNADDIRNAMKTYDVINPIIPYDDDVSLIDIKSVKYDLKSDLFYLNAIEDKRGRNKFKDFQKKYCKLFSDTFKNQEPVEGNKLLNTEILKK